MILIIFPIILGVAAITAVWVRVSEVRRSRQSQSNVLPLSQSGGIRYPVSHNVFTDTRQEGSTWSTEAPVGLNFNNYLDGLSNYTNVAYGGNHMRTLAQDIINGGANQSIETALINTSNSINGNLFQGRYFYRPCYRLGQNFNPSAPIGDFEVLVFTGGNAGENRHLFDAAMLNHAVTRTYGNTCRTFQTLNSPNRQQLEAAIIARAQSARANNRRLYIFYLGHGEVNGYQAGVAVANHGMEGSRRFTFNIPGFDEDDYKNLLNTHLTDIVTTSVISACHSGAAVTAIDNEYERRMGISVA